MYSEIHYWQDFSQKVLYFKVNNAFNLQVNSELNFKFSGIYAIFKDDVCLYVGQSNNLASRITTHLKGKYGVATDIFIWNIEDIGFSNFRERDKISRSAILDNCEKYLIAKLKPIENLLVDMDFKLEECETPNICFESDSTFSILVNEEYLAITDSYSFFADSKDVSLDILNYQGIITDNQHSVIKQYQPFFGFHLKGFKNDIR